MFFFFKIFFFALKQRFAVNRLKKKLHVLTSVRNLKKKTVHRPPKHTSYESYGNKKQIRKKKNRVRCSGGNGSSVHIAVYVALRSVAAASSAARKHYRATAAAGNEKSLASRARKYASRVHTHARAYVRGQTCARTHTVIL